jgi:hypothetical protein
METAMARLPFVPEDWLDGDQQAGAPVIRGKTLFFPFHDLEILGDKNAFSMSSKMVRRRSSFLEA